MIGSGAGGAAGSGSAAGAVSSGKSGSAGASGSPSGFSSSLLQEIGSLVISGRRGRFRCDQLGCRRRRLFRQRLLDDLFLPNEKIFLMNPNAMGLRRPEEKKSTARAWHQPFAIVAGDGGSDDLARLAGGN